MKKWSRRIAAYGLYAGLVAAPFALAGDVTMPHELKNGTTADADQVNDNFEALAEAVNDNDARLAELEDVVSFHAVVSSNTLTSTGTLILDREIDDLGNGYDEATGVYTVPQSGVYQLSFYTAFVSTGIISMTLNGTTPLGATWASAEGMNGAVVVTTPLSAGDTISLDQTVNNGNLTVALWGTTTYGQFTSFSGHRIGQ